MITIVTTSDNLSFRIGQKITFLVEYTEGVNVVWTLNDTLVINSNEIAVIENSGIKTINDIAVNYCIIRLINTGDFYIKALTDSDFGEFSTSISGVDILWVGAQTKIWNTDLGTLCYGYSDNVLKTNKWSLFKPIRSSSTNLGNKDIWLSSNLWKQNGAGMKLNIWSGTKSMISFTDYLLQIQSDDSWDYLNPRGSEYNEYFRLGDFRGYTKSYNNSILKEISSSSTNYKLKLFNNLVKENWDSYELENNDIAGSMLLSDIWTNTLESSNLGEYYLMIYVIDTNSNRHFFKALKKLSEQATGSFIIESPLEELYLDSNLLESTNFFQSKGVLKRYYFIANKVVNTTDWIETTKLYKGQLAVYNIPGKAQWSYNYLLEIFTDAIALPLTSKIKNYKIENEIDFSTEIQIEFKNEYSIKRNIYLDVLYDSVEKYKYFSLFNSLGIKNVLLESISSGDHGILKYKNSFKYDVLHWETNSPVVYENWYRPTILDNNNIYINFSEVFDGISELLWNSTYCKLTLLEEYITINFNNNSNSNTDISIQLLSFDNGSILNLTPDSSNSFKYSNNSIYKFKNLSEYVFRIYNLDNNLLSDISNLTISSSNINRLNYSESHINTNTYIDVTLNINIENGLYNTISTPLTIDITMLF